MGSQEGDHGGDCPVWPTAPAAPAYCSPPTRGLATVVGATDVGAQRWAGNRRDSPRGFWRFCRVVPATSSSSRAIVSRRAGHAPKSLDEALLGCTGCQGIPSPFRCPPVPLNLPFPFRCLICCPFGTTATAML